MKTKNSFGEKIRELRGKQSLRAFSEITGLSHTFISSVEKGEDSRTKKPVNVTADTIIKFASSLNIDPHELFQLSISDKIENDYIYNEKDIVHKEEIPTDHIQNKARKALYSIDLSKLTETHLRLIKKLTCLNEIQVTNILNFIESQENKKG